MGTKLTYTEAFKELQQIVEEMENSQISLDDLDSKVKRAAILLKVCREKLFSTEKNVQETLKTIDPG